MLDRLKKLSLGHDQPDQEAYKRFDKATRSGRDMEPYRKLLARAIGTLVGKREERAVASLFQMGGTHAMKGEFAGINDFEVVAFLVASAPSDECCFMTGMAAIAAIVTALDLPPRARVDTRVPKKMLVEQGAPTTADKRAIQDGVDEIHWLAALKPNTIAIPAFTDEIHDYSEIAVIAATFRPDARATRLTELIHRAIPYPVLLITTGPSGVAVSVRPNVRRRTRATRLSLSALSSPATSTPPRSPVAERAFMESIALKSQPARDLSAVYEGWLARIEALVAARLSGVYEVKDEGALIDRRRTALEEHARLAREAHNFEPRLQKQNRLASG